MIKTLMMVSNTEKKYFSRVCIKARSVEISLLAAVYKCSISKSRRSTQQSVSNSLYNTTWRRITANKCSSVLTIPNTVVVQGRVHICFHVDIENEILCYEPGMSAFIFSFS